MTCTAVNCQTVECRISDVYRDSIRTRVSITGIESVRGEAVTSGGLDRSLRVWKIPEETQLRFQYEAITFLDAMKKWGNFDSSYFYRVLRSIRSDLVYIALNIPWLCTDPSQTRHVISLIEMLEREISIGKLQNIDFFFLQKKMRKK